MTETGREHKFHCTHRQGVGAMQTTERHGIPFRSPLRFEWLLVLLRTCHCSRCRRRGRAHLKYGSLVGGVISTSSSSTCPSERLEHGAVQMYNVWRHICQFDADPYGRVGASSLEAMASLSNDDRRRLVVAEARRRTGWDFLDHSEVLLEPSVGAFLQADLPIRATNDRSMRDIPPSMVHRTDSRKTAFVVKQYSNFPSLHKSQSKILSPKAKCRI